MKILLISTTKESNLFMLNLISNSLKNILRNKNLSLDKITENNDFKILKDLSSNEFRSSWTKLENSKNYIDMISNKLDQIEKRKAKKRFIFF